MEIIISLIILAVIILIIRILGACNEVINRLEEIVKLLKENKK